MGIFWDIVKLKNRRGRAGKAEERRLPRHIAIVMDGNRRWAKKRGLPSSAGYSFGAENFRKIATYCKNIGIEYLTVYAFSTENWKRSEEEVSSIMTLLEKYLNEAVEKMEKEGIKLNIMGNTEILSPKIRALVEKTRMISQG
jgi:undecaprenyl diphosphate synthase